MRLVDLSQPVYDACPNCPAHPPVRSEVIETHEQGGWQVEKLTLASHTGSHIDAPLHRLKGAASLDDIPLENWVGSAFIADLRDSRRDQLFSPELLASRLPQDLADRIVLLATGWGDRRARTDEWLRHAPLLSPAGACWLAAKHIRGVGIDYYSLGDAEVHEIVLGAGIWIVEELRFPPEALAIPQPVQFWSLPINLRKHSGAFCRPVIVVE